MRQFYVFYAIFLFSSLAKFIFDTFCATPWIMTLILPCRKLWNSLTAVKAAEIDLCAFAWFHRTHCTLCRGTVEIQDV
ncbi:hypothetical protein BX666DRAFT_1887317 [Dichotomocladium elegans]|nr:hypothetical protein BX666DRAFT_1887317 [Dichotomocladium elegans]